MQEHYCMLIINRSLKKAIPLDIVKVFFAAGMYSGLHVARIKECSK